MMTSGSWRTKARRAVAKVDARDFVFDRIFDRQNFSRGFVENCQHGSERRGLAAAGRAGKDQHAVRQREQFAHCGFVAR
jgi:hypothetical protein